MGKSKDYVKAAVIAGMISGAVGLGFGTLLINDANKLSKENSKTLDEFAKRNSSYVEVEKILSNRYGEGQLPDYMVEYLNDKKLNLFKHNGSENEIKNYEQNDARANFEEASGAAMLLGGALCLGAITGLVVAEKRLTEEEKEMGDD